MNRFISAFGLLLIVLGVALGSVQLGAFDQIVAERDASVSVAGESEAYLSVQEEYDATTVSNYNCIDLGFFEYCYETDRSQTVISLENRYVSDYSTVAVSVDRITGTSDTTLEVSNPSFELTTGDARNIVLACSESATESGTADVTLQVQVTDSPIEIYERTTIQDVSYDCDPDP